MHICAKQRQHEMRAEDENKPGQKKPRKKTQEASFVATLLHRGDVPSLPALHQDSYKQSKSNQ